MCRTNLSRPDLLTRSTASGSWLAAIVSPTDPVAVSSIAARVTIPKRLMHILEGESLLNDASGLVCFRFAAAAAMTGSFSLGAASLTFLWLAVAGVAIGAGVTAGVSLAQRWLSRHLGEESGSSILINLLTPFGAYLAAEHLSASGILAAVAAGITMSYVELGGRALATTRVQREAVHCRPGTQEHHPMFVFLGPGSAPHHCVLRRARDDPRLPCCPAALFPPPVFQPSSAPLRGAPSPDGRRDFLRRPVSCS